MSQEQGVVRGNLHQKLSGFGFINGAVLIIFGSVWGAGNCVTSMCLTINLWLLGCNDWDVRRLSIHHKRWCCLGSPGFLFSFGRCRSMDGRYVLGCVLSSRNCQLA